MTRHTRRSIACVVAVLACALPIGSAQATNGSDNVATATIQQDDGRAFDFAWDFERRKGDDPVLNRNEADAFASCMRCKATAIAFQIVLVQGNPATVVPQNIAQAANTECTDCTVVAEARQFVRVTPERVRLTMRGRAVLEDVRRDLAALQDQDLPADQIHQAVENEEARVKAVLNGELVPTADPTSDPTFTERKTLQAADLG